MALKKDSLTKKLNDFFVMNWWLTGISNIIIIILFIYYSINLSDYKDETTKRINQANLHIIYGTPDGRVALLDRQTVNTDNEVFQNHIALIAKNMETSESQLTHGFDPNIASKIVSPVDLLKVNENFVLLYKEFFANKNVTLSFLRYYFNLLKAGNLAKKNTILKTTYQYSPDPNRKNGFESFNTSYVSVQDLITNVLQNIQICFNTSYVSVQVVNRHK